MTSPKIGHAGVEFVVDLRTRLKKSGYNGETRYDKGVITWIPRFDQTEKQIKEANAIVDAWDDNAQKEWREQSKRKYVIR